MKVLNIITSFLSRIQIVAVKCDMPGVFLNCCSFLAKIEKANCGTPRLTGTHIVEAWQACAEDVETIPAPTDHVVAGDITLKDDAVFYSIGLDKIGSSYEFNPIGEGQSKEYDCTVIIFVPGVHPSVSKIVTGQIRGEYVLIVKDKNGVKHIVGAPNDGAEVAPNVKNDRNGYTITYKWRSGDIPYNYTGAILEE